MQDKYRLLQAFFQEQGQVAVAFSGGVDSSLLLQAAMAVIPGGTTAVFADSVLQKEDALPRVRSTCRQLGCSLQICQLTPFAWPEFIVNDEDRCYYCKGRFYRSLQAMVPGRVIVDGTNFDDLGEHRPGLRAIKELGVMMPLVAAGLGKGEIRILARDHGLACWDLPSESCLATRVKTGSLINSKILGMIARAEKMLADLDFHGCRVASDGKDAFIALVSGDLDRFCQGVYWPEIEKSLVSLGFGKVFLDLYGRKGILV